MCSSGGAQAFQFATEEKDAKFRLSIDVGKLAVLVQSQRRQRLGVVMLFLRGYVCCACECAVGVYLSIYLGVGSDKVGSKKRCLKLIDLFQKC